MSASIRAFIQARMASYRFPGKVLAPFRGQPLIQHVVSAIEQILPPEQVVVATSSEKSDDPLVSYLSVNGTAVFRGPLNNVFERFRFCVSRYPCDWILRVSADSPLIDYRVLQAVIEHADQDYDLVTTIFPRTFPSGQNAELIRVSSFLDIDQRVLSATDQEHVTSWFYKNPDRFRIFNVASGNAGLAQVGLAVDTIDDLHRLEQLPLVDIRTPSSGGVSSRFG